MPQIIRDSKQDEALEKISTYLGEIGKINTIIASGDYSFKLQAVGGAKAKLAISPAQNDKVITILKDRKKELVKEVRGIARANRIAFDDKEELAMSDAGYIKRQTNALGETPTNTNVNGEETVSDPGENNVSYG